MGFEFEKLDVYKKALEFSNRVYDITKQFPSSEIYGIISQMRRASISIPANIAEGSGRYHKKDFSQYLRIARGSVYECVPLIEVSLKQKYIGQEVYDGLISSCNEIARMVNGLINSLSRHD